MYSHGQRLLAAHQLIRQKPLSFFSLKSLFLKVTIGCCDWNTFLFFQFYHSIEVFKNLPNYLGKIFLNNLPAHFIKL